MTTSAGGDEGKVLTPVTGGGSCELRKLDETEILNVVDVYTCYLADISTASSAMFNPHHAGTITRISTVLHNAITVADAVLTGKIDTTAITDGEITVAYTASAAGDIGTVYPSALNTISASQYFQISSDGGSTTTAPVTVTVSIQRT
jgi:hypothetical protein